MNKKIVVIFALIFSFSPLAMAVNPKANRVDTDTTNFDNNLSASDTTVQAALETLDEAAGGGGGAPTTATYITQALNGSLSAERVIAEGSYIDLSDGGANGNMSIAFDPTELTGNITWGAGGDSSKTWTQNLSGTDPVMTFSSGTVGITGILTASDDLIIDTSDFMVDVSTNFVGIGDSTPDTRLDVEDGSVSVGSATTRNVVYAGGSYSGGDSSTSVRQFHANPVHTGTDLNTLSGFYSITDDQHASGTTTHNLGNVGRARQSGGGLGSLIAGGYYDVSVSDGTATSIAGLYVEGGNWLSGDATATTSYGLYVGKPTDTGTAVLNDVYGVNIAAFDNSPDGAGDNVGLVIGGTVSGTYNGAMYIASGASTFKDYILSSNSAVNSASGNEVGFDLNWARNNANTGTTGEIKGIELDAAASDASGTVAGIVGIESTASNSNGATATVVSAFEATVKTTNASAVNTAGYGYRLNNVSNTGTFTDMYGFYAGDLTTGTQTNTPFSFYNSDASTLNYFAGNTGFGDTSPAALLTVGNGDDWQVDSAGIMRVATGAAMTTDGEAEVAFDNNAWAASHGALQVYDGTASGFVVATTATDTPSNGQVPQWNTGGTITWETPSGGAETNSLETIVTGILDDEVPVGSAADDSVYTALPSCSDATTSKLLYNSGTNSFSCGSDQNSGAATNINDIGDATADGSVAQAGFEMDFTSTLDSAGKAIWTIYNTDAATSAATTFIDLYHDDGADSNVTYFRGTGDQNGTPQIDYEFKQTAALIRPDLTVTGVLATTGGLTLDANTEANIEAGVDLAGEVTATDLDTTLIADNVTVTGWVLGTSSATTLTAGTVNIDLLDGVGAVDMDYGSADITDHTFITDGTGDAEFVLPDQSISSTEILNDTVTTSDLNATLTFSDGDLLDFGTNISSATEGILIPAHATSCASATAEGQVCWEEDADNLWVGDGAAAKQMNGSASDTNAEKEYVWPASATLPLEAADSIPPIGKDAGTNIDQLYVAFDSAADECRTVNFKVPSDVTSGTVTFKVNWYSAAATTGAGAWDFRHNGGVATGTDPDQSLTLEFIESDTTAGTAGQLNIASGTETIANLGWSANEQVDGVFCRDGDGTNGTDDLTGDALATQFSIQIPRA